MMKSMEQSVELVAKESEVLLENLSQCHFVNQKSHMIWSGLEADPPLWKDSN
jgi:hypothetical protein